MLCHSLKQHTIKGYPCYTRTDKDWWWGVINPRRFVSARSCNPQAHTLQCGNNSNVVKAEIISSWDRQVKSKFYSPDTYIEQDAPASSAGTLFLLAGARGEICKQLPWKLAHGNARHAARPAEQTAAIVLLRM